MNIKSLFFGYKVIFVVICFITVYVIWVMQDTLQVQKLQREMTKRLFLGQMDNKIETISLFLQERRRDLKRLSKDERIRAFFINRNLGMSMQYGLRASYLQMIDTLKQMTSRDTLSFKALSIRDKDGSLLASVGFIPASLLRIDAHAVFKEGYSFSNILRLQNRGYIRIVENIKVGNNNVAILIGYLDLKQIFEGLLDFKREQVIDIISLIQGNNVLYSLNFFNFNGELDIGGLLNTYFMQGNDIFINKKGEFIAVKKIVGTPFKLAFFCKSKCLKPEITFKVFIGIIALLSLFLIICVWIVSLGRLKKFSMETNRIKNLLDSILNSIQDGIFAIDKDYTILFANKIIEDGESLDSLVGKKCYKVFFNFDQPCSFCPSRRCMSYMEPVMASMQGFANSNSWIEVYNFPFYEDGKELSGAVVYVKDITQKKLTEAELKRSKEHLERVVQKLKEAVRKTHELAKEAKQANKAKSIFLSNVSHEIRTPLNAILGLTQLFLEYEDFSAEQKEHLLTIKKSGELLLKIINDILEISKIESGKLNVCVKRFNLKEVLNKIESIFRVQAEQRGLNFNIVIDDFLLNIDLEGDEQKFVQVLVNLVSNAIKFTSSGDVEIRIRIQEKHEKNLILRVEVKDSGPGIAEKDLESIFRPFEQTKVGKNIGGGTGLGLTLSKHYIELLGGRIGVESELGKGSIFWFELPFNYFTQLNLKQKEISSISKQKLNLKILAVDDDDINRMILKEMLEREGATVLEASNGEQAIEKCFQEKPDIVLMDIRMPKMDGLEATKKIREVFSSKEVKVVALTASAFEEDKKRILETGVDEYLRKPFEREDLLRVIYRLISNKES